MFFDTFERKSMDLDNTDYLLAIARVEEKNLNLERAAKIYERIIELDEDCISAYDRLMIVYRKLKQLKKELYVPFVRREVKIYLPLVECCLQQKKSKRIK